MPMKLDSRDMSRTLAATNSLILEANSERVSSSIVNNGAVDCIVRRGSSGGQQLLKAGGGACNIDKNDPWYGEVWGNGVGAVCAVVVQETFEVP